MAHEVQHNEARSRYELLVDGTLVGIADYRDVGGVLVFPHTEISPAMRGQGLGEVLVQAALDDVRATGATIRPACWFVAQFMDEHPEYRDLLAA